MGGVAKISKIDEKSSKNRTKWGPGGSWGSLLLQMGPQSVPKVARANDSTHFWVKIGPPRGPQIDQKIEKIVPKSGVFLDGVPNLIFERFGVENCTKKSQKSRETRYF